MDKPRVVDQPFPAWGDTLMPVAGAERQARMRRLHADTAHADPEASSSNIGFAALRPPLYDEGQSGTPGAPADPSSTPPVVAVVATQGNWTPLEGPGNETMREGLSSAPRGYTGGAMGRTVAGLSRSFQDAASGAPPDLDGHTHQQFEPITDGEAPSDSAELTGERTPR